VETDLNRALPAPHASARVVVVGGGAAGTLVAAHLLRRASPEHPVEVRVIERGDVIGPGVAYGAADPHHLLNNTATRMSAYPDDPDHLLRWCAETGITPERGAFLPRRTYGRYLSGLLGELPETPWRRAIRVRGEAVRVDPGRHRGDRAVVQLSSGWTQLADTVVLALGTPPPRPVEDADFTGGRYVADPWLPGALDGISGSDRVLLLGTGLTMVDVAISLVRRHPNVRLVASSRHGLVPRPHASQPVPLGAGLADAPRTVRGLLAQFRRQLAQVDASGHDWQGVVDGVREQIHGLWRELPAAERERFLRHVARRWEVHRHRMAPAVHDELVGIRVSGALLVHAGGVPDASSFTRIVNCTGPQPVCSTGWSALVDGLLTDGLARPDALGLGLDVDADGRVRRGDGSVSPWLHAVGFARRGTEYETTAVPELREQARALSEQVLATGQQEQRARRGA
jgi:uncharacterized NAD(P)/FAD-binding protein YdhS